MGINKDSQKAPNLRFKGFTDDWEQRKLSSMTMYKNGKSHEDKQSTSGKYELINLNSISISGGLKHSGKFIEDTDDTLQKDDLVMILSDVGHGDLLGRVALIPNDNMFVLNQRVALLRPNETADPHFLFSYINAHQYYFKSQGAGMSQLNISKGSVENFTSNVPTIQEQNYIGSFLKQINNIITLHQRKLDQLNQLKAALLQQMFPGKGETVPKLRFAGFEGDWEERKLGEISKIKTGSSDLQDADATGNYPFFVRSENIERSNRFLFEGEAILIPGEGRLGEIYHYINGKFDYHQRVYKISNFSDYNVQGLFVLYYLKKNFKRHALKYTVKATVDSLRLPTLLEFNIMVPNNEEQQHISNLLNGLEKLIQANENKINDLKTLKTVLLQNMFI